MPPKITIIIVVFNGGKTIRKAIDSVLTQTYNNRELLIVDGLSTDNTVDILKEYNDPTLRYISEKDKGIYDAMNKGVNLASGEWLYFLGSDDYLYNNHILNDVFSDSNINTYDYIYGNIVTNFFKKKYDGVFDQIKILKKNICHQSIFYKKSIHQLVGYYNIEFRMYADWDFNIKCFYHPGIQKKYIPLIIAFFSKKGESTTNPDFHFLRTVIFPYNLKLLNTQGLRQLHNIRLYDEWWRLIRSLKLTDKGKSVNDIAQQQPLPIAIKNIYLRQKKIKYSLLRNGFISKIYMFASYFISRLNKDFLEAAV